MIIKIIIVFFIIRFVNCSGRVSFHTATRSGSNWMSMSISNCKIISNGNDLCCKGNSWDTDTNNQYKDITCGMDLVQYNPRENKIKANWLTYGCARYPGFYNCYKDAGYCVSEDDIVCDMA
jgi:hypothetical protein